MCNALNSGDFTLVKQKVDDFGAFLGLLALPSHVLCVLWLRAPRATALIALLLSTPTLITALILLVRYLTASTCNHTLYVRPIFYILVESADVTSNLLVFVHGERNHRDEADGEPRPSGDAACGPVATVTALSGDVFGSFELVGELWMACQCMSV